jgi:hypothetical protein
MSTLFQIKRSTTDEPLKVALKKRQPTVDGITPPDVLWLSEKPIDHVTFSMKKAPERLTDTSYLYPDGTIHYTNGTILNPLGNTDVAISSILLSPGEVLNADYSVTQVNSFIRYPNQTIIDPSTSITYLPSGSHLHPNGLIGLPPTQSFPLGYIYNPGGIDRANYYLVGNPTSNTPLPDGEILLPDGCTVLQDGALVLPNSVIQLPSTSEWGTGSLTVNFPFGSMVGSDLYSDTVQLPKWEGIYPVSYVASYSSVTRAYSFPSGTVLVTNPTTTNRELVFLNNQHLIVPKTTIIFSEANSSFVFPHRTEHIVNLDGDGNVISCRFWFPGDIYSFPKEAPHEAVISVNLDTSIVSVTFASGTLLSVPTHTATLTRGNLLLPTGNLSLFDDSLVLLNTQEVQLHNTYTVYPRGTMSHPSYTDYIHPAGSVSEGEYIRYYPTLQHPSGLLVRTDGAIVNGDGSFTKLDNSIVDGNDAVLQQPSTIIHLFPEPTSTPPVIPPLTESSFIVINDRTGSFSTVTYPIESDGSTYLEVYDTQMRPRTLKVADIEDVGFNPLSSRFEVQLSNATVSDPPLLQPSLLVRDTTGQLYPLTHDQIDYTIPATSPSVNYELHLKPILVSSKMKQEFLSVQDLDGHYVTFRPADVDEITFVELNDHYDISFKEPKMSEAPLSQAFLGITDVDLVTHFVKPSDIAAITSNTTPINTYSVSFKPNATRINAPVITFTTTSGQEVSVPADNIKSFVQLSPPSGNWTITLVDSTAYSITNAEYLTLVDADPDPFNITSAESTRITVTTEELDTISISPATYLDITAADSEQANPISPLTLSPEEYFRVTSPQVNNPPVIVFETESSRVSSILRGATSPTRLESATLLSYEWHSEDTAHDGLYLGKFTIHNTDLTTRTFPIRKDDYLLIEILPPFSDDSAESVYAAYTRASL